MATKSSKTQKEKNTVQVVNWIIEGYSDVKILDKIQQSFDVGLRQARNYKKFADARIKQLNDFDIDVKRKSRILQVEHQIQQLYKKELRTAKGLSAFVNAQNFIMKLEGTEVAKKVQLSGDEENPLAVKWVEEKTYLQPEEEIEDE